MSEQKCSVNWCSIMLGLGQLFRLVQFTEHSNGSHLQWSVSILWSRLKGLSTMNASKRNKSVVQVIKYFVY